MLKLNIGCGEVKLDGFVNIDSEERTKPDLVHDIVVGKLPYKGQEVDEIYWHHNIEHIQYEKWPIVFSEFYRLLKPEGRLFMSYPEFEICAKYFIENHRGQRDYWRKTLYGRQLWPGDYHISPVITSDLINQLGRYGFTGFKSGPSIGSGNECYTNLICFKGIVVDKESVLKNEIFPDLHASTEGKFSKVK